MKDLVIAFGLQWHTSLEFYLSSFESGDKTLTDNFWGQSYNLFVRILCLDICPNYIEHR